MIGRIDELKKMKTLLKSTTPQIVMLTGRRRVGKTYIIEQAYKKNIVFSFTGTKGASMKNQLKKFMNQLNAVNKFKIDFDEVKNWTDAFDNLNKYISKLKPSKEKHVVFLDEFPWIKSAKSAFIEEFGYWWNENASKKNILVAISGSATTWMIKNIIGERKGLHGRVTNRIHLQPFTLAETKLFVHKINQKLTNNDIADIYMCMGGIPLYLEQIEAGDSVAQIIYKTCFKKSSLLRSEFNELYAALFDNHENYIAVIRALNKKWQGMSRNEIATISKIGNGGGLTRILENLESCNFILSVKPFNNIKKGTLYRLADEYSKFYLSFIENNNFTSLNNWMAFNASSKTYKAWQGYSFENVCIKHIEAIKKALGIAGIVCSKGFQIDLLIDRSDNVINICEIKFYNKPIVCSKAFNEILRNRRLDFIENTKTTKAVFNTVISTYGLEKNTSSDIDSEVKLVDLFTLKCFD
jgi:uncharacterized protein